MTNAIPSAFEANAYPQMKPEPIASANFDWHGQTPPPLVVDLDGTLTKSDTLVECALHVLKRQPWLLIHMAFWVMAGRARFKQRIAERSVLDPITMPWRQDFLDWLGTQQSSGRQLILATAAHRSIAERVASHFGFFSSTLATNGDTNLKGSQKLDAILAHVGTRFSYAGDSTADLKIWESATTAVLVGASSRVTAAAQKITTVEAEFSNAAVGWREWARALRVHQWTKNLLIFVPLFAAFRFAEVSVLVHALAAFVAFSLVASATYVFNDLWDLSSDRDHPRKRMRPFASGAIPITQGVLVASICAIAGLGIALWLSSVVMLVIAGYVAATTWYSLALKHYVLIDVLMLALLYTLRISVGSLATDIAVTSWLLSFSVFMFFSLALVKRCAELTALRKAGREAVKGRDYQVHDLVVLWPLGIAASICAVVVFGLYIGAPETATRFANTTPLWFVGVGLIYWTARLWIKTARGEMHDDPIVFAFRDGGSRLTIGCMLSLLTLAHVMD